MVKLYPYFFGGLLDIGKMDMDGLVADTVEPANSLLNELLGFRGGPKG